MEREILNSLNEMLQGEHMAVEAFNTYIDHLNDERAKNVFQDIQNQHRQNMSTISNYIQDMGHKPNEKLGFKGIMGDIMLNSQIPKDSDDSFIIEKAVEAETKGINMGEKAVRGNLDNSSRNLVGSILQKDRMSLDKLQSLN